jgi:hypothetical protein
LKELGIAEGARLTGSKGDMEERIEAISGVLAARVEATCCDAGKIILYVGIQEKGAPTFEYRAPPADPNEVPEPVRAAYARFLDAIRRAGSASEDLTRGHSLVSDPDARAVQEEFVPLANEHAQALRDVIRGAVDPEQRAIAVYVIAYADKKSEIVNEVQYALQDIDDTVRANAIRALAGLIVYERKNPQAGVKIAPTWLIEMLNSVTWTDRNNAAIALVPFTESRDEKVLAHIRERAFASLIEMSRWRHLPHAMPAYILLGRVAGISEAELQEAWSKDNREAVIKRAAASGKR